METLAKPWADFGLSGLVIGALIFTLWFIGKTMIENQKELLNQHRDERKEWLQAMKDFALRYDQSADKTSTAINDLHRAIDVLNNRERRFNPASNGTDRRSHEPIESNPDQKS